MLPVNLFIMSPETIELLIKIIWTGIREQAYVAFILKVFYYECPSKLVSDLKDKELNQRPFIRSLGQDIYIYIYLILMIYSI